MATGFMRDFVGDVQGHATLSVWDFGDGTTPPYQTEPNPVHTYISPVTYNVTLTVTNAFGMHSITKPVTVTN